MWFGDILLGLFSTGVLTSCGLHHKMSLRKQEHMHLYRNVYGVACSFCIIGYQITSSEFPCVPSSDMCV